MKRANGRPTSAFLREHIAQRMKELGYNPSSLRRATGLTGQGLLNIRNGEIRKYQARTTQPITMALRWTPDSIERLLRGEPPITWEENLTTAREALRTLESQTPPAEPDIAREWERNVEWIRDVVSRLAAQAGQTTDVEVSVVTQLVKLETEMAELRTSLAQLQLMSEPALAWLDEVAAQVGVARPPALESVL